MAWVLHLLVFNLLMNRMRSKLLLLPAVFMLQFASAQTGTSSVTLSQETAPSPGPAASSTPVIPANPTPAPESPVTDQVAIMDYKSVFETATVEEEVKMATERFNLTAAQQDVWLSAAKDRRETEKQAREKLNAATSNYEKDPVYRGLKSSQNTFHETIVGYLSPAQKQSLEADRLILLEKQKRLAKLPPPPPPAPTVTIAPTDSTAIKEVESEKMKDKKSKKKKKSATQ